MAEQMPPPGAQGAAPPQGGEGGGADLEKIVMSVMSGLEALAQVFSQTPQAPKGVAEEIQAVGQHFMQVMEMAASGGQPQAQGDTGTGAPEQGASQAAPAGPAMRM